MKVISYAHHLFDGEHKSNLLTIKNTVMLWLNIINYNNNWNIRTITVVLYSSIHFSSL